MRGVPLFLGAIFIVGAGVATFAFASGGLRPANKTVDLAQGGQPQGGQTNGTWQTQKVETPPAAKPAKPELDAIGAVTFGDERGTTYVLARDLAARMGSQVFLSPDEKTLTLDEKEFTKFRRTYVGDVLIPLREVTKFQGVFFVDPTSNQLRVTMPQGEFAVEVGKKRIDVDQSTQELNAYQGNILVIKTNVSTGRPGHHTPNGDFQTGPKERMHYSHKYNDAEMPYAIQVNGDVFLHGYTSVPSYPASHGCVRIPLGRKNPARYLFGWVERGIDTKIHGEYSWERRSHRKRRR